MLPRAVLIWPLVLQRRLRRMDLHILWRNLVDLVGLDKLIDDRFLPTSAYATSREALYGSDAEDVLHTLLFKAVDYTHKLYLKAKPKGAPGDSPENILSMGSLWKV